MAKHDIRVTDNPKLKQRLFSDGPISLYLAYYLGYSKTYDNASLLKGPFPLHHAYRLPHDRDHLALHDLGAFT
jgi:hypothetical protein